MAYYVYENWRAHGHRATVHLGQCSHCNNGEGRTGKPSPNGRWHGPFNQRDTALSSAAATGGTVRSCGHCGA